MVASSVICRTMIRRGYTMQIGCTKKLQDYLKEKISPVDVTIDPFFSWSASLVTVNRRKTIVIVNDYSRCGFVLYGVKAK